MKKILLLLLLSLSTLVFAAEHKPLPVNQAFQFSTHLIDPNTFVATWKMSPGYFLYRDRFHFKISQTTQAQLGKINFPIGVKKSDVELGNYQVYFNQLQLPISILGLKSGEVNFKITYQGCSDSGFCYPPTTQKLVLNIDNELGITSVKMAPYKRSAEVGTSKAAQLLHGHNLIWIILGFYVFGLLLAFTPCVLPMVPIISGIIVGHGHNITTRKAFRLSLAYVLGMAITYTLAGVLVALVGSNIQAAMQNPIAITLFSLLFVILALSMFGFYDLKLPSGLENWLNKFSKHQSSGHYASAAIMGCLSSLMVSPCITAPLIGALGYIGSTGDVTLGAVALFCLSLGMGTPLLLVGASAGKLLPKAGSWMNAVKNFFGVVLIAIAIYLLERILPSTVTMFLWGSLLIISAIYLGALYRTEIKGWKQLWQGVGVIALTYGVLILFGTSMGNTDPLLPLSSFNSASIQPATENRTAPWITLKTLTKVDIELTKAKASGKPVFLDFYADWCTACKAMDRTTFKNSSVLSALKNFVWIKVDVTSNDADAKELLAHFSVIAPPTFLFFDKEGNPIPGATMVGEMHAKEFLEHLPME
ncbi:MAG: protein-disulfide reductase DsbD [Proteobacteria bacterium]|nr:protein-disulfide reductase DsbD [Pseudomonadota bacterium]